MWDPLTPLSYGSHTSPQTAAQLLSRMTPEADKLQADFILRSLREKMGLSTSMSFSALLPHLHNTGFAIHRLPEG
jgi:hypothetical protein